MSIRLFGEDAGQPVHEITIRSKAGAEAKPVVSPSRRVVYLPDAIYDPRTPQQPSGKKGARSGDASARRHGGHRLWW